MTRDRYYLRLDGIFPAVDPLTAKDALMIATIMRKFRLARCSRLGRKNARVYRFSPRNVQEMPKRRGVLR